MKTRASASRHLVTVFSASGLILLASVLTSGCQGVRTTRIQENPALFQSLDGFTQKLVRAGLVNYGFTSETVYMSLGKPDRVAVSEAADGRYETWSYRNFLYDAPSAVKIGMTNPGLRPQGSLMYTSSALDGSSLGGSRSGSFQPTLNDVFDTPFGTLVLGLLRGRVVSIHIER